MVVVVVNTFVYPLIFIFCPSLGEPPAADTNAEPRPESDNSQFTVFLDRMLQEAIADTAGGGGVGATEEEEEDESDNEQEEEGDGEGERSTAESLPASSFAASSGGGGGGGVLLGGGRGGVSRVVIGGGGAAGGHDVAVEIVAMRDDAAAAAPAPTHPHAPLPAPAAGATAGAAPAATARAGFTMRGKLISTSSFFKLSSYCFFSFFSSRIGVVVFAS